MIAYPCCQKGAAPRQIKKAGDTVHPVIYSSCRFRNLKIPRYRQPEYLEGRLLLLTKALSRWFQSRTLNAGKRARRVAIVALARKLVVALWRYLETGLVPVEALMKA